MKVYLYNSIKWYWLSTAYLIRQVVPDNANDFYIVCSQKEYDHEYCDDPANILVAYKTRFNSEEKKTLTVCDEAEREYAKRVGITFNEDYIAYAKGVKSENTMGDV